MYVLLTDLVLRLVIGFCFVVCFTSTCWDIWWLTDCLLLDSFVWTCIYCFVLVCFDGLLR